MDVTQIRVCRPSDACRATATYTLRPFSWTHVIGHDYATAPNIFHPQNSEFHHRFGDDCMGSAPFGGCNHIPILHSPIANLHVFQITPRDTLGQLGPT